MERRARLRRNFALYIPKHAAESFIILEQLRDNKMVKNIFPKIGGRLRLAHEENDQLSMTTESEHRSPDGARCFRWEEWTFGFHRERPAGVRRSEDSARPELFEKCLPRQDLYPILRFARRRIETYQQGSSNTVFFSKPTEPFQMGLIGEF
jgi:hypothetical protein